MRWLIMLMISTTPARTHIRVSTCVVEYIYRFIDWYQTLKSQTVSQLTNLKKSNHGNSCKHYRVRADRRNCVSYWKLYGIKPVKRCKQIE
jgi:hypothetical protein